MMMPRTKFDELSRERQSYAAEQRSRQVAAARSAIRDLEPELKRLTSELQSFAKALHDAVMSAPDDVAATMSLTHSVMDRARSRGSVASTLAGQRLLLAELRGHEDTTPDAADEKSDGES